MLLHRDHLCLHRMILLSSFINSSYSFWAADPKGTMSCRAQGRIFVCLYIRPSVPPQGLSQAQGCPGQTSGCLGQTLGGPSQALRGQNQALGGPNQAQIRPRDAQTRLRQAQGGLR